MKNLRCLLFGDHKLRVAYADDDGAVYQCERCKGVCFYLFHHDDIEKRLLIKWRENNKGEGAVELLTP